MIFKYLDFKVFRDEGAMGLVINIVHIDELQRSI